MKNTIDFYQVSLKIIIKNENGEILALKAKGGETFENFYDLPGGRIDVDELSVDFEKIAAREIAEEVGDISFDFHEKPVALGRHVIKAKPDQAKPELHILYVFFEADYTGGDIRISDEHCAYEWINLNEINLEQYFCSGILDGLRMYARHSNLV